MSRYFLYVHPCLPVINEAEFWPMLNQEATGKSSFSLLVFQAMMFAACSYISLADAQKWGAESILEMRNSFYRRAKFLYNFGVENDPLCIAQALTLLTYQSSGTNHLSNTTWLGLAIQQAHLIHAHLYHRCPVEGRYKRSELKRLWWCLIIRDRIVSLGMRRPLQILPTHFEVASRDPLLMDDLSDEIHTSQVYDSETKEMLCKIMTSLCRLAVSLTNVIMTLYPLDPFPDGQGVLTALYFESARLALYQYISFRIHRNQRPDDWPDLMDAVTAIHDVVKRFVVDGTAGHLPISAVAYTALPQMVLNLNLRLSSDTLTRRRQENVLSIYMELNRQYVLRYDVSHVSTWVNRIVRLFEMSLSPIKPQLADLARRQRVFPGKDCLYLLELEPELYFKISGMMDASMSTGQLALEYSGTRLGFPSQDLSLSLFRGESSDFPAIDSLRQSELGQILPLDEDTLEGEDEDPFEAGTKREIGSLSRKQLDPNKDIVILTSPRKHPIFTKLLGILSLRWLLKHRSHTQYPITGYNTNHPNSPITISFMAVPEVELFWQASAKVMAGCQLLATILRDIENKQVFTNKLGLLIEDLIDLQYTVSAKASEIAQNKTLVRQDIIQDRIWQVEDIFRGMLVGQEMTAVDPVLRPLLARQFEKAYEILDGILMTPLQRLKLELGPTKYVPVASLDWEERIEAGVLDVPW
ncbi:uncharacterized protein N7473_001322 [Penicillium subrubescens]|uniref:uncharacterized protein n=1 Tax=Penicillium subrubescens TaxID=1316194 RepID=UPI002544FBF0|nr:uncharacterized protein N7473_001322 [Penicillium subrubescens]KAJ5912019.1 hypothetical protein N7473_001322 [Penicillium subrubescens]